MGSAIRERGRRIHSVSFPRLILERATDSVVVWRPTEPEQGTQQIKVDQLVAVIRKPDRPAARFGQFDVWRRADESP
jgi:hypothetical protein